jgi:hypothetical protein
MAQPSTPLLKSYVYFGNLESLEGGKLQSGKAAFIFNPKSLDFFYIITNIMKFI